MTYCLAIKMNQGLVFASDSRTNAGVDYVRTYCKMHRFCWPGERIVVILSAGNLATAQGVVNRIQLDIEDPGAEYNLLKAKQLFEIAQYVGRLSVAEQRQFAEAIETRGGDNSATFIIGGQIRNHSPEIYLVYPEGNSICASPETPFLQLGETKYGKPILDRIITAETTLDDAARCALVSLDSTMRSNISVGPPLDLAIYTAGSLEAPHHVTLDLSSPFFRRLQRRWNEGLQRAFDRLPRFDWEEKR